MNNIAKMASVSALALITAAPVHAQAVLVGTDALDERIDDIQSDVEEELAKGEDDARFGGNQYAQGWSGGLSLGFAATSGNTDTADLSLGGRFRYGAGPWNHTFGFAVEFADDNGVRNKEEAFVVYDANRYFSDSFYVFGIGSVHYDAFATNEYDAFLGFGPGYRVVNTETVAWRIQAGPGVRYTQNQLGADATEFAGMASSRLYYKLTEMMFLTNDTDVLASKGSTVVTNDFGVNFKMTDMLSTRLGYRTEYDSDPLPGFKNTDNTLGASLVYGF
ncbi:DUF481 domain-containing protein [Frigidibacter sp. ROC022]|uniref:DUF481 domain-containing protein n=1 Tax=Frigidibacter sp. ROC022 TaxID=2971796 RepID=UPI00215A6AD1|nr:DUF481 domain-containing protein [Frigidibacter sp. ROC022]MCR8725822.1 DUF481 domain-containing protein [Frigidibacter sp. ROC022]